jgi:phosphohistidine phosphatase
MSREIIILRHAQAAPSAGAQRDFDRALTAKGREEAQAVGRWFAEHGLRFDRVVSSPAARARETAELALPEGTTVAFDAAVYDATPGTLLSVLDRHAAGGRTLLVGHNPGLEQLVAS